MQSPENIDALMRLQPDYMGLIFYEKSPRYVGDLQITDLQNMPDDVIKTGVFVNEEIAVINSLVERFNLRAVQLHGNESPAMCEQLRSKVAVLKAFGVDENFNFDALNDYAGSVDYFLFDTKTVAHGGSGQTFNWQVLDNYILDIPFFLSGGLSLENSENIKHIKHPAFYGVDLNSKFEIQPGLKDTEKLSEAFKILRD